MSFYVSITTIRKYKVALDTLLSSLPKSWLDKYIVIYQNEPENSYTIFDDGHIEVYITNNLSDYGNWIGLHILLEANIISKNTWFLFIHDTCKLLDNCVSLTYSIIAKYANTETDIVWLCNNGQCNLCLLRTNAIHYGYNLYKDINYMSKMETIEYEWNHQHRLSPKSFPLNHVYIDKPALHLGKRYVYNNTNNRDVLLYTSINMEKYFYFTLKESDHPFSP
jgi:hypothetical protein